MPDYYSERLSADRLRRCYQLATPRVQQYLDAEIFHVASRIRPSDRVLELGCGYGRVMERLVDRSVTLIGVDTSASSLLLARENLRNRAQSGDANQCRNRNGAAGSPNQYRDREGAAAKCGIVRNGAQEYPERASVCHVLQMDAGQLAFGDETFDVVLCIQNGLSAINVQPRVLIREAIRVTRPGGRVLFSSYADGFWPHRLEWFRLQAEHGLIGPIDDQATRDGVIVCRDGFRATTIGPDEFRTLTSDIDATVRVDEVDGSSVFCELQIGGQ